MKSIFNNKNKLYINALLKYYIFFALTGTLLQTFLLENGFKESTLTALISFFQLLQTATLLVFSAVSDKIKRVIPITAIGFLLCVPIAIYYIFVAILPSIEINLTLFVTFSSLFYLFSGIYSIISTKLQYLVIHKEDFGKFVSFVSLLCGILGVVCSALISALQLVLPFNTIMTWVYILTAVSCFVAMALVLTLKPIKTDNNEIKETRASQNLLKYKPFVHLILPNLLRGLGAGIIGYLVTVGYYLDILNSESASIVVIVTNFSTIGASFLLTLIDGRVKYRTTLLVSGILIFITLPLMVISKSAVLFIIFYGITYLSYQVINVTIPIVITRIVDYDMIGKYTGGRMLLYTIGTSLVGFICIPLFDTIGVFTTLVIAGATQLFTSIFYYIYLKKHFANGFKLPSTIPK